MNLILFRAVTPTYPHPIGENLESDPTWVVRQPVKHFCISFSTFSLS